MRGRFGRKKPKRRQMTGGGAVGLTVGALGLVVAISILLLLRRKAVRNGTSTEEATEEPKTEQAEGRPGQEEVGAEGHKAYFRKLIEETNERSGL